jgi:hypothetical protein
MFILEIREKEHKELNEWIERSIGFIPPIPPRELSLVLARISHDDGSITSRLIHLIEVIRAIADASDNSTVKISMTLTWRNIQLQGERLGLIPQTPTVEQKEEGS